MCAEPPWQAHGKPSLVILIAIASNVLVIERPKFSPSAFSLTALQRQRYFGRFAQTLTLQGEFHAVRIVRQRLGTARQR